jgi:hypothetical protein
MVKRESLTLRGILRVPRAGNDADDSCSCNTAATTVEEFEVNHSSTTANDAADDFSSTNAFTGMVASKMEVRSNLVPYTG